MATVTPDVIFDSSVSLAPLVGGTCRRVFYVSGLTPGINIGFDAIAAVQNSGNNAGFQQQHPSAAGFFVQNYDTRPGGDRESPSQTAVFVTVTYRTSEVVSSGLTLVEVTGSNGQTILGRWPGGDQKGQPIVVGYKAGGGPTGKLAQPFPASQVPDLKKNGWAFGPVNIPVPSPNTIIRFTRREVGSPLANSQKYRRCTNGAPWFGFAIDTVLCRRLDGVNLVSGSIIAPGMFEVVYEFEYNPLPGGWNEIGFFHDPHSNVRVTDIAIDGSSNGYTIVNPYLQADFNTLNLPNPFVGI